MSVNDGLIETMANWLCMVHSEMPNGWHQNEEIRKVMLSGDKEGLRKIAESIGVSPRSYIYYGGWSRQELNKMIADKIIPSVIIEAAQAMSFDKEELETLLSLYFFDDEGWRRALMVRESAIGMSQLRFDPPQKVA